MTGRRRERGGSLHPRVRAGGDATGVSRHIPPLRGLVPLVLALAIWQLVGSDTSAYFPRPSEWIEPLKELWEADVLGPSIRATLETFAFSLILATLVGTVIGALVGRWRSLNRALGPILDYCRFMPAAAIVPVAVLAAGYTERMKIIVVVFAAMWPIVLQVRSDMLHRSPLLREVSLSLHLSRFARLRKVLVPSLVPGILLGVRIAAPSVLIVVLLVEIVTQVPGVGGAIAQAQSRFDTAAVYGLLAIGGILGLLVNVLVAVLEGYLLRYRQA
jgi:ABC-type nitrate/sulfonate/bicarbonate transport system permease component